MTAAALSPRHHMGAVAWLLVFVPGHLFAGRLGVGLSVAVALVAGVTMLTQPFAWEARGPARRAAGVFFLLFLADVVSYAYSTAFNGIRTGPWDLWALTRPLFQGAFAVYLIRYHDESALASLESALAAALYFTLFFRAAGLRPWPLFEPAQAMGYLAALTAIHFLFFSRAVLSLVHAVSAVLVLLYCLPSRLPSSWEALASLRRSPVFGWGPAQYEPVSSFGGQYLRWLLRDGASGAVPILIGLVLVASHLMRAAGGDRTRRLGAAAFLAAAAGMLLTGAYLEDFRVYALTAFLIAGMGAAR